jgi:hypothetical protein
MARTSVFGILLSLFAFACSSAEPDEEGRFDEQNKAPEVASPDAPPPAHPAPGPGGPSAPGPDDGPPAATPPNNGPKTTCRAPRDLGAISGDDGSASVSAQGSCSEWVRVRVTEDYQNAAGVPMKLTASLLSGEGTNFDLYVYENPDADTLECDTASGSSDQAGGQSDVVKAQWGEGTFANNSDDGRTVSIEVRNTAEGCAARPWTLLLQGNY